MSNVIERLMEELLETESRKQFNALLMRHGPIEPSELGVLSARARDSDPVVRRNATVLLSIARTDERFDALRTLAITTDDPQVLLLAANALPNGVPLVADKPAVIRRAIHATDRRVVIAAIRFAARTGLSNLVDELRPKLDDPDYGIRAAAIDALGSAGPGVLESRLRAMLSDPTQPLAAIYRALLHSDDPTTADVFARSLEAASLADRVGLLEAIRSAATRKPWVRTLLLDQLTSDGPFRWSALRLLAESEAPPVAELAVVCRDYLAARLALGNQRLPDEGTSECALFLEPRAEQPFSDFRDMLAFASALATNEAFAAGFAIGDCGSIPPCD